MRDITVALLIYKSNAYLDFVMDSLLSHKNVCNDRVKYLIVANDADEAVKNYLKDPKFSSDTVSHVIHNNPDPQEWWIQRVYRAWNRCLNECKTPYIVFVNSDMAFTDGWLDNLLKFNLDEYIPTSRLVESGRMPSIAGLISMNFGQTIGAFSREVFEEHCKKLSEPAVSYGGAYMPSLFKTMTLKSIGGWSHNANGIPGDQITFAKLNKAYGLKHIMVHDSLAYHLQRGESVESNDLQ